MSCASTSPQLANSLRPWDNQIDDRRLPIIEYHLEIEGVGSLPVVRVSAYDTSDGTSPKAIGPIKPVASDEDLECHVVHE
jgi:hypothetical protein